MLGWGKNIFSRKLWILICICLYNDHNWRKSRGIVTQISFGVFAMPRIVSGNLHGRFRPRRSFMGRDCFEDVGDIFYGLYLGGSEAQHTVQQD